MQSQKINNWCFEVSLPLPPPINQTYNAVHSSRLNRTVFFMSYPAKKWKKEAQDVLSKSFLTASLGLIEEPIKLTVTWYLKRDRDIDSGIKLLMDSLQGTLIKNDSQIEELMIKKDKDKDNPHVVVKLQA